MISTDVMYVKFIMDVRFVVDSRYKDSPSKVNAIRQFDWPMGFNVHNWREKYCTVKAVEEITNS